MKYPSFRQFDLNQSGVYLEAKRSMVLTAPLAFTQLLDGMLGFVDTLAAGTLEMTAVASLAAANGLFWAVICMMGGFFTGLDIYIPRAFGEQNQFKANTLLIQGVWIALVASVVAVVLILCFALAYNFTATPRVIVDGLWMYLAYVLPSAPMILIIGVLQRYWQSQNYVKPFTLLMIAMNCLNVILDFGLIQGWFGPVFGVNGIALSTTLCRLFAFIVIIIWSFYQWRTLGFKIQKNQCKPDYQMIRKLASIGLPSVGHLAADIFAFNVLTFLAAQLGIIPLAAHQIMFMITCITVMLPIGISHAVCIRIGQCIGDNALDKAKVAAQVNLLLCSICMSITGIILFFFPYVFIQWFTDDRFLIDALLPLLKLCGVLQIADGLQLVYVGILRAYGEVKRVFLYSVVSHYGIGLPLGLVACYGYGLGVFGLWLGVTTALFSLLVFQLMLSRRVIPKAFEIEVSHAQSF